MTSLPNLRKSWVKVGLVSISLLTSARQSLSVKLVAVFNNVNRGEWYVTQNMCPHKQAFVLSQGIIEDHAWTTQGCVPVAQEDIQPPGRRRNSEKADPENHHIPCQRWSGTMLWLILPAEPELDAILGTNGLRVVQVDLMSTLQEMH